MLPAPEPTMRALVVAAFATPGMFLGRNAGRHHRIGVGLAAGAPRWSVGVAGRAAVRVLGIGDRTALEFDALLRSGESRRLRRTQ